MDSNKPKYGKVWARGFYDGMRAAENKPRNGTEDPMNEGRYKSVIKGLSSIARKVYESVPVQEEWTAIQVLNDMNRRTGSASAIDKKVLLGCLNTLVKSGVVKELPASGAFKRVQVVEEKSKPNEKPQQKKDVPMTEKKSPEKANDLGPLDRIAGLTAKLRSLADEIDDELLNVEKEMNDEAQKYKKLNQLQELLKSI